MRKRKAQQTNQNILKGIVAMALIVLLVCYLFLTMVSCSPTGPCFRVEGNISDAEDSTLVLEVMAMDGIHPLDSICLGPDGSFAFTAPADTSTAPEFYRLRIGQKIINFVVDSLETICVTAPFNRMTTDYEIQGNEASRTMKTISLTCIQLQQQITHLQQEGTLSYLEKTDRLQQLINDYKQLLKQDFILRDPSSPAAYFALFQTVGGILLFNPETDRSDVQYFAAVATQWDFLYPGTLRTENLKNIALRGLKNTRKPQPLEIQLSGDKIQETGIIDFGFPDIRGCERRLSDFHENVVLLDFTAYSLPQSQQRILELRELYEKYHHRGLEIYQVSLDPDEHYWKTMCESLPWVCVYCTEGINNDMIRLYGIQSLPSFFIIARGSEMKARGESIKDLRKAIEEEL